MYCGGVSKFQFHHLQEISVKSNLKKVAVAAAISAGVSVGGVAQADPFESGFNISFKHSPIYELEDSPSNSTDGDLFGAEVNWSSKTSNPMRVNFDWAQGGGADTDDRVAALELSVGNAWRTGNSEIIPFIGLGLREARQSFDGGSSSGNPARKHRLFYVPIGFYTGTTNPLNQVNIYYSAEIMPVISGEADLGRGSSKATMAMSDGLGFELEAGFHFPTSSTYNFFSGFYLKYWEVGGSEPGVQSTSSGEEIVTEAETETQELGLKVGIQF